jgi:hypothetical protein
MTRAAWSAQSCVAPALEFPAASSPPLVSGDLPRPWPVASSASTRLHLAIDSVEQEAGPWIVRAREDRDLGWGVSWPAEAASRGVGYSF